jgi:hypothetical protein
MTSRVPTRNPLAGSARFYPRAIFVTLAYYYETGFREVVVVPTSGHGESEAAEAGHERETGLLNLSSLSLEDLARLDDSVVADVVRDLVLRRRYGSESGERFSNFSAAI